MRILERRYASRLEPIRKFVLLIAVAAVLACSCQNDVQAQNFRNRQRGQQPQAAELTAEEVQAAIDRAIRYLKSRQTDRGNWRQFRFNCGVSSLCTLAMLNAGEDPNSQHIQQALRYIKAFDGNELATYSLSLRVMVLAAADPAGRQHRADIAADIRVLLNGQTTAGPNAGGWTYHSGNRTDQERGAADSSNSQFALLALNEAAQMGIQIPDENWRLAKGYWERCFIPQKGGFDYRTHAQGVSIESEVTGSMTCAGIASTIIIGDNLADGQGLIDENGNINCCAQDENRMLEAAIEWVGTRFSTRGNPSSSGRRNSRFGDDQTRLYYLYALERAGRLSGRRFFGPHDWYRAGASALIDQQKMDGSWQGTGQLGESIEEVATAFALLFLSKGKRPVVIGKYEYGFGNDWDNHPKGVHQLTRNLEQQWNAKLTWQTVDSRKATANELLETPVLFISGRNELELDVQQKENLKKFVENGGFIFAEACQGDGCGEVVNFDRDFRALMNELFPDSPLEPLAVDHPIWNAHYQIREPLDSRPLLGLQACCRTSVVYCPRNLSCLWQADRQSLLELCNAPTRREITYASQLGQNVVSYATGRQVRDKLDTPTIDQNEIGQGIGERIIVLPKLQHNGGADEAPNAWRKVKRQAMSDAGLLIKMEKKLISPTADELPDYPFVFMHGRERFRFSAEEREAIRNYLSTGFGFILADSVCTSNGFNESFRAEMAAIMQDHPLEEVPADDPLWTQVEFGFPLERVTLRIPDRDVIGGFREEVTAPKLEGIKVDGRWVVLFSPYDMSCALENASVSQCEGYTHEDAMTMCIKILLYRLQTD
ncbi:MAG: DUF4159 domain-containing protein [Planctomycetota bacterium]